MDYHVGSVAALISGNVTPNRPKIVRRALTPTKHQPSPNVTPKSEFLDDRSIFLSPSVQKKKAIVKKSPKRIFQNPDFDATDDGEGISVLQSPKAEKVKKHLKDELDADPNIQKGPKSPKKNKNKVEKLNGNDTLNKIGVNDKSDIEENTNERSANESTQKKKKNRITSPSKPVEQEKENVTKNSVVTEVTNKKSKKKKRKSQSENIIQSTEITTNQDEGEVTPKKKKKKSVSQITDTTEENPIQQNTTDITNLQTSSKKKTKKKNKNKKKQNQIKVATNSQNTVESKQQLLKKKNKKNIVNPNAITNEDTDSEHDSDDDLQSENEQTNNQILDLPQPQSSDDEEEKASLKKPQKMEKKEKKENKSEDEEEEIKRTLFIGNVPFSAKCKKEIKNIFNKYGDIQTVRIRTIPVKDARYTPKLAVIKNELHPDRTSVNVYVKFKQASSVNKALVENNKVLDGYHLRVTPASITGSERDPQRAIFVGNLPFAIEDGTLRAIFEKCGEIESVRVIRDSKTNVGKGFGYVNFASKDSVELALALTEEDLTVKNRIIRVKRTSDTKNRGGNSDKFHSRGGKFQGEGRVSRGPGKFNGRGGAGGPGKRWAQSGAGGPAPDGAYRRMMKKRESGEAMGGPPNKRMNISQPAREKRPRKEFVGMTAGKKKKQKVNKGQKKKKALSEILTKPRDN